MEINRFRSKEILTSVHFIVGILQYLLVLNQINFNSSWHNILHGLCSQFSQLISYDMWWIKTNKIQGLIAFHDASFSSAFSSKISFLCIKYIEE